MHWHQLDHMQTICSSLQTDDHTNTPLLNYYKPDALPDAQPTASKHWRLYISQNEWFSELEKIGPFVEFQLAFLSCYW